MLNKWMPNVQTTNSSTLYLRRCSPEKFCAKQMVLKNVIRTNWDIQKSKVQNNIMCPLGDSSWYRQPILPKFGGFFGLCCTSPLKGHMIWFCTLLFCIPQEVLITFFITICFAQNLSGNHLCRYSELWFFPSYLK